MNPVKILTDLDNKYMLDKKIGEGSFGVVIKAYQTSHPFQCVAIKKSNLKGIDVQVAKYIREESILLRQCDNKNIIKYIDHVDTPDDHYLIIEYCPMSLKKFWKAFFQKHMPENILLVVLKQLASGLSWIHQKKIIHRDIKLENIMINISDEKLKQIKDGLVSAASILLENQEDLIKIIDFGVSKNLNQAKFTQTFVGSPLTLAPEILSNQQYGFEVDIYSLGVIMYLLIAGDFPYGGDEVSQIFKSIQMQNANLDAFPDYSKELKQTILQMLKFSTDERLTFQQLYNRNLFNLEKEEQIQKSQFYQIVEYEQQKSRMLSPPSNIHLNNKNDERLEQSLPAGFQTSQSQNKGTPQKSKIRIIVSTSDQIGQSEKKSLMQSQQVQCLNQDAQQQYQQPQQVNEKQPITDQQLNRHKKKIVLLEETSLIDNQPLFQVHQNFDNNVIIVNQIMPEQVNSQIYEQPTENQQQLNQNIEIDPDLQQDPETQQRKNIKNTQFKDLTKTRISKILLEKLPREVQDQLDCFCIMYDRCTLLQQAAINIFELELQDNKFQRFLLDMCHKLNNILWNRMLKLANEDGNDKIIRYDEVTRLYRNVEQQQKEIEKSQRSLTEPNNPVSNFQEVFNLFDKYLFPQYQQQTEELQQTDEWYGYPPNAPIFITSYRAQLEQIIEFLIQLKNQDEKQKFVTGIFVLLCYKAFDMDNLFCEEEYDLPDFTHDEQYLNARFIKLREAR